MDIYTFWQDLCWPLIRLLSFICLGLLVGNFIEALNWTRAVAFLVQPLTSLARLKDVVGASFSMAFFSGVAANTMLAEAWEKKTLSSRELVLANLFNSLPTYFLHLPSMFFLTVPFIGSAAIVYVSLTFAAAVLRTVLIMILGRFLLPPLSATCVACELPATASYDWQKAWKKTWLRFQKRIKKIIRITVPVYLIIFLLRQYGVFTLLEELLSEHVGIASWLNPKSIPVIIFYVTTELTAGLATAGALLVHGDLGARDVVLALLVGNVLSSPMRAFRHQFPYYAGIYRPKTALLLIGMNQTMRVGTLIPVGMLYYFATAG